MASKELTEWLSYHVDMLGPPAGQDRDAWGETLAGWLDLFELAGYTPNELTEATRLLVLSATPPRFVADHLAGINSLVKYQRQDRQRRQPAAGDEDRGTCELCGNAGFVTAPNLQGVKRGRWVGIHPYAPGRMVTVAVLCSCWAGKRRQGQQGHANTMTLGKYEDLNPGWREQLELSRQERLAQEKAGPMDPKFAAALKGLVEKARRGEGFGLREEDEEVPY